MKDDVDNHQEASAARAMDRVLHAERAAQAALAECEKRAAVTLEAAREQRQRILERAQARMVALHTGIAESLERRAQAIAVKRRQSTESAQGSLSDTARRRRAVESLAGQLTTDQDGDARDAN